MSTSFFKHSNNNFQKSRSIGKSTPPFKSQQLLSVPFGLAFKHYTAFIHVFCTVHRTNSECFSVHYSATLFTMEGRVYRAVQTESSNKIKLILVFILPEFCHNADLQTQNLNRMPPTVHFLLPYLLHFPLAYLYQKDKRALRGNLLNNGFSVASYNNNNNNNNNNAVPLTAPGLLLPLPAFCL